MKYREFAKTGIKLSAVGLGCMGMSHAYGQPDDKESLATLNRALELGINFWDTADIYGNGTNEELVSTVLSKNRDKVFLATKFGFRLKEEKSGDFSADNYVDCSPKWIRQAVEASLKRLKIDTIDLYYAHRVDPNVPVEETVGAMAELVREGKVRYLGLSECSADALKRANAVHPIAAVQSEYSLLTRGVEREILPLCKELGIAFIPFSPLARGLITNKLNVSALKDNDFRRGLPRYSGAYWDNNQKLSAAFAEFALDKNCTAAQLALAWVLAQGEAIIPIPGTKRRTYLEENAGAVDLVLSPTDLEGIESLIKKYPNIGPRYSERENKYVEQK